MSESTSENLMETAPDNAQTEQPETVTSEAEAAAESAKTDTDTAEETAAAEAEAEREITATEAENLAENSAQVEPEKEKALPAPATREEKILAIKYLICAAIALCSVYVVQIFHLFDPLFDRIYYGNLTQMFFYICNVIFWIPFIIVFARIVKRRTGFNLFRSKGKELSLKRSLIIYACAVVPIFIVSAALGFEIKVVFELGKRVTGMQLYTNAVMYGNGAVKLIIAIMIMELVQEAMEILYRGKYCNIIPWGGIALAVVYGLLEVAVAYGTGLYTMFAWLYIAFDLLYGVIYLLSEKKFTTTFFVSLIIYIL